MNFPTLTRPSRTGPHLLKTFVSIVEADNPSVRDGLVGRHTVPTSDQRAKAEKKLRSEGLLEPGEAMPDGLRIGDIVDALLGVEKRKD